MPFFVQTKENYIASVAEVLEIEAKAIQNYRGCLGEEIIKAIELLLNCSSHVIVTGMGKSGLVGKKISATLASTGTPSFFLHPAEGLHGDLGMVTENDVIIAISNSGETEEIIKIIPSIKRIGAKMIAFVGNNKSTLGEKADIPISIGKIEEACPLGLTPTTSTTLTLALGDAIAIALLKARNFTPEKFALYHPGGSLGRKLLLTVEDVVQQNFKNPIVNCTLGFKEVLFKMTESGIGAVSIVNDYGLLIGILTDGDLRRALTADFKIMDQSIESLYNRTPVTVTPDLLAVEALKIIENNKINVLPVVNEDKHPIAMIHIQDLTKMGL
ncbi:KpsF/GutQ family sugar-phosphate isomerase [Neobacillus drentensis]|uniref:KpsF/GutQ family sugar-phosphate isomerase n=1 Tax=Neobacillus drentensis TaxID=220684 RepID=UPI00285AE911|nr:KpsF/GutQ family sugar-phosphate isomerase [Neobacillus drentensis]MDR7239967.1 arabinose-5-phosphate isomerase [Neobacillus drentensis]